MTGARVGVVVGNPKANSRTFAAARVVAELLAGRAPDFELDLADFGAAQGVHQASAAP